jgi:hypothetical protein
MPFFIPREKERERRENKACTINERCRQAERVTMTAGTVQRKDKAEKVGQL